MMVQIRSATLADYQDGVRLRRKTSREKHADLRGATDRDGVTILRATDRTRVPELVPVRYQRMLANPFAFLRGAAAVVAEDLRHEPTAGIPVQACGDCHLMNFGAFVTPEQNILFDINDFDDTPGVDFTADLKRLGASVAVAALAASPSKQAGTGDRGDYCRSLSHPSAQRGKAFPVGNLAQQSRIRARDRTHRTSRVTQRTARHPLQGAGQSRPR
jgi:hypothetical protein